MLISHGHEMCIAWAHSSCQSPICLSSRHHVADGCRFELRQGSLRSNSRHHVGAGCRLKFCLGPLRPSIRHHVGDGCRFEVYQGSLRPNSRHHVFTGCRLKLCQGALRPNSEHHGLSLANVQYVRIIHTTWALDADLSFAKCIATSSGCRFKLCQGEPRLYCIL